MKVILKGGLGNQLFQLGLGVLLSRKLNCELEIDVSLLNPLVRGQYNRDVGVFNFALPGVSYSISNDYSSLNLFSRLKRFILNRFYNHFHGFIPSVNSGAGFNILDGYFQSYRYYIDDIAYIKSLFTLRDVHRVEKVSLLEKEIQNSLSYVIHVRRGDYAEDASVASSHLICFPSYYQRLIDSIESEKSDVTWFVFSDDTSWVRNNLSFSSNVVFVSELFLGYPAAPAIEIHLMSFGYAHVISNSTFSWWGAFLKRSDGPVYTP